MQVGIFNCLFIFVIAALNDYRGIHNRNRIRNSINCAALTQIKWELAKLMVNQHNYITGIKPCVLAAMDKTSTLQTLLKMHHTEAGEHRECYMDTQAFLLWVLWRSRH